LLNQGFYSLTLSADIPFQKILIFEEGAMGFSVEQTGGVSSAIRKNVRVLFALNSNGKTSHWLRKRGSFWGRHKLFELYEPHL